ncbi:MAG: DALR anticodon-binding domain-containing protein, partial [Bacillota bacterium]
TEAAICLEPHRIARYTHELAGLFHSFYNSHRVMGEDRELQEARLVLVGATRTVLRNALSLLGVGAPESM